MPGHSRKRRLSILFGVLLTLGGIAWLTLKPESPRQLADRIQIEVAGIRGLEFKHPVPVMRATREEWRDFIAEQLKLVPEIEHHWAVMRMVGVYRGPDLGPRAKVEADMLAQGGHYDARRGRILLGTDVGGDQLKVVFAHELYHGLQDQHFDMQKYLLDIMQLPKTNTDEFLARRSVIEGDAAFVDGLYQAAYAPAAQSTPARLLQAIGGEEDWDPARWQQRLEDPALDAQLRFRLAGLIETTRRIPPFMIELSMSPYLDGSVFIRAVQQRGWSEVAKLYGEYPPISTEQVLHPEKWFAREEPATIAWPPFDTDPLFADWKLLLEDRLGERQWRAVFRAQGMAAQGHSAAAGWNGDRYAVFRHKSSEAMLMLLYTCWDTPEDASEFAAAYGRLLEAKYRGAENAHAATVQIVGSTVRIVEATPRMPIEAFMAFDARAELSGAR